MEFEKYLTEVAGIEDPEKITDEQKELLTKTHENYNTLETANTGLEADVEFHTKEKKEIIAKRDAAKTEVRELKLQIQSGAMDKELGPKLTEAENKISELEDERDKKDSDITDIQGKLDAETGALMDVRKTIREDGLSKLKKGSDAYKFAEQINIKDHPTFLSFVKLQGNGKLTTSQLNDGDLVIDPNKTWDQYTSKELDQMDEENKVHHEKLYRARYPGAVYT